MATHDSANGTAMARPSTITVNMLTADEHGLHAFAWACRRSNMVPVIAHDTKHSHTLL